MPTRFYFFLSFLLLLICSCATDENTIVNEVAEINIDKIIKNKIIEVDSLRNNNEFNNAFIQLKSLRNDDNFYLANDTSKAIVYHKFGVMNYLQDEFFDAKFNLDTAILLIDHIPLKVENSYYLRALAKMKMQLDEDALNDLLKSISYVENTALSNKLKNYYTQAGELYHKKREINLSKEYFDKAEASFNGEENEGLANFYNNKGNFYKRQGAFSEATSNYQKAQDIFASLGEVGEGNFLLSGINIGFVYILANEGQAGEAKLKEMLQKIELSKNDYFHFQEECYNGLGYLEVQRNNPSKAERYYRNLLQVVSKSNTSPYGVNRARAYEGIADTYVSRKKYSEAISNYHKAIQSLCIDFTQDDVKDSPSLNEHLVINKVELLRILGLKAVAWELKFKSTSVIDDYIAALETYETIDGLLDDMRMHLETASAKYKLIEENLPLYERAIQIGLDLYNQTNSQNYLKRAYHFVSKNKAIVLQDGLRDEDAKYNNIPTNLIAEVSKLRLEWFGLEAEIIDLEKENKKEKLQEKKDQRFETIRVYEKLITKFEKDYPAYHELKYKEIQDVDPNDIAEQLPPNTAIVEYFIGNDKGFVFTISKDDIRVYDIPKPDDLLNLCSEFKKMIQNDSTLAAQNYSKVAYSLYKTLLEEPLTDLKKEEISRLVIIPDDYLAQLSFDGLFMEPLGEEVDDINWTDDAYSNFLLHDYAISYAYSNRLIFRNKGTRRVEKALKKFVGFGLEYDDYTLEGIKNLEKIKADTILTRGMGKLEHAIPELEDIQKIIGKGNIYINQQATKDAFDKYAPSAQILHFAMHGFESIDNPLNSALVFSRKKNSDDFLLKASELYSKSLNADMVVLSACNTATGVKEKGEGVRSLARSFRYAGCQSIVATLWSVSDFSTKEIIIDFYTNLKTKDSKDVALQKAKLKYIRARGNTAKSPIFYWTNLIVIGDITPLQL